MRNSAVEPVVMSQPALEPGAVTLTHVAGPSRGTIQPENILTQANHGDLDWSYTSRCVRRWSPNSLLTHLYSHAFSVPPRDPKPSFLFVNINLCSQEGDDPETVSLPHSYRLPLLMVAKYLWGTVLSALSAGREEWLAQATNIFHISRLCENLFASARVKVAKGGMEKGWRCLVFNRFLTRFYNRWTQNDPASNEIFWKKHEAKEYDRDVLKHDWKRWSLKGLNGIVLTEQEVSLGLSADQFRKTLVLCQETHTWILVGKTLSFITSDEGPAWTSVSELTDVDLGEEEEVKPSLDSTGSIYPASAKGPTGPFGTDRGDSVSSSKRLRFIHRSSSGRFLSRKVSDPVRLSTLRKSARTSSEVVSPSVSSINSAIRQMTSFPKTGAQSNSSSQTPIHSSSRNNQSGPVVLIKRRAQVTQTEISEQSSIRNTNAERSNVAPSPTHMTQSAPPSKISKRDSRLSSRKKEMENDTARSAKKRRIDEFDIPMQSPTLQAPHSSTNGPKTNGIPYNWDTQRPNSMRAEVSSQTMSMPIAVDHETQTDDTCIGPEVNVVRDSVIRRMPTATTANKTTTDVAIQAGMNPLRDDNSLKVREMGNTVDGCTAEIQNNLTLVVDNLVSSRLVSLIRALKQSSGPGPTPGSSINDSTLCESSAVPSTKGASSMDRHLVNGLFDEIRLLREESHTREQKTREEMREMRHLHNVEVDSLRRRLAYLESQSHEQVVSDCDTRRAAGESFRGQTRISGNNTTMPPRLGDKQYHFPDDDFPSSSFDVRPFSNGNGFSGNFLSTTRRGDIDEDSPLPSKAQRKSHIITFSRPSATG